MVPRHRALIEGNRPISNKLLAKLPPSRALIAYSHDLIMAGASFVLAMWLRLGDSAFDYSGSLVLQGTLLFILVAAPVFWAMGLYRGVWLYASLEDVLAIGRASTLAILLFLLAMFLWTRLESLPRSLLVIQWFILPVLLGGPRFLYRMFKDRRLDLRLQREGTNRIPVLLAGASDGAELFIRHLSRGGDINYRVVGILADRAARVGRRIHGVEVLGTLGDLAAVVDRLGRQGEQPQRLIVTKDDLGGTVLRRMLETADSLGMTMARLPRLTDFRSGEDNRMEVRPIAIEDLLGRPKTALDRSAMAALIQGKRVLITGGGGSIGGELARQIAGYRPAELVLFDSSEFNLYAIDMELGERHPTLPRHAELGDVRDQARVARLFREHTPELVFHAAALKHVPLVEANPVEGVATNVQGTVNVADACVAAGVGVMVMISTDKAVNPSSVMGATKRIAESYCQRLDMKRAEGAHATRFVTVRFGNVLGSTGSVVPLFQRQLAAGGPLTVTHPDMKRYFMTIGEAVELVLQTSALGIAEDDATGGRIHVLDMGEPVAILDLARQMIRLAGHRPDIDIKIAITGPRPGEKLFEELFHGGEPLVSTACKGVLLAAPRMGDGDALRAGLAELRDAVGQGDRRRIMATIHRLVPEYRPDGTEQAVADLPAVSVAG